MREDALPQLAPGTQPGERIEFGKTTDFTTEAHISEPAQSGITAFTPLPKELAGDACAPVLALDQPEADIVIRNRQPAAAEAPTDGKDGTDSGGIVLRPQKRRRSPDAKPDGDIPRARRGLGLGAAHIHLGNRRSAREREKSGGPEKAHWGLPNDQWSANS